jgi:RNA polymerase-binding protein DksA
MTKKQPRKLTKAELSKFRELLLEMKRNLERNLRALENGALRQSRTDATGDLSTMPRHIADMGTDCFEQDFNVSLMESEEEELREIAAALERIDEGTFGICEECSRPISKSRLKAIPYTRLCIDCKRAEEKGLF